MVLEEITASQEVDIVDDQVNEWLDDRSKPELEFQDEQQQSHAHEVMNMRVLEWLNEMVSDLKETSVMIQDLVRESMKYKKNV